jgi:hypothetical protein
MTEQENFIENLNTLKVTVEEWREDIESLLKQRIEAVKAEGNEEIQEIELEIAKLKKLNLMQAAKLINHQHPLLSSPYKTKRMLYDEILQQKFQKPEKETVDITTEQLDFLLKEWKKRGALRASGFVFVASLISTLFIFLNIPLNALLTLISTTLICSAALAAYF